MDALRRLWRGAKPAGQSVFAGLRGQVIDLDPETVGIRPTAELPNVWGVLMEMGRGDAVATVVALADGTTSLYTSTGGGMIGGGGHTAVLAATRLLLLAVEADLNRFHPVEVLELPVEGETRFNVLTYTGRFSVSTRDTEMTSSHPLLAVYTAGQNVITELRQIAPA